MSSNEGSLAAWLAYGATLAAAVGAFLAVRAHGATLHAPGPSAPSSFGKAAVGTSSHTLMHVLLALVVIVIVSRLVCSAFRWIRQPPVIGETLAGIMLGPSLLGRVAPDVQAFVLPATAAPFLGIIAQVGVVLFMFLVGLELDTTLLRERTRSTIAISHASIVVPFVLGSTLSLWLYPRYSTNDVPFGVFALFAGVAMSVTAFPVLSRILTDGGLAKDEDRRHRDQLRGGRRRHGLVPPRLRRGRRAGGRERGAIIVVACVGKVGGSTLAARLTGLDGREALTIGVLMNTRGLMELVVLHVGLELGVLSPTLFAMMVVMALVTTFATSPIVHGLQRGRAVAEGATSTAR